MYKDFYLLPLGYFNSNFYKPYLQNLDVPNVNLIDLPSRTNLKINPIETDALFLNDYFIGKNLKESVLIGISTSTAVVIELLKIPKLSIGLVILVFPGEFIDVRFKALVKILLNILNSNRLTRYVFNLLLKFLYPAYQNNNDLDIKNLLKYYKYILDWRIDGLEINSNSCIIVHSNNDYLIDQQSKKRIENYFLNKRIYNTESIHEPSERTISEIIKLLKRFY